MKIIMSSVLMGWAILLIGLLPIKNISAAIPDAIDLGNINKEGLDRCLFAIAIDPNMLLKIDQRNFFNKDDVYLDVLRKTLNSTHQFIPYDVNNPAILSDVNKPKNLIASLCLDDSRVYFWNTLDDRDVIGWVSIQGQQEWETSSEPKLMVWIIPHWDKSTSFVKDLNEDSKQSSVALKALMKLALDIGIEDTNNDIEQLFGMIKTKANRYHNVKIVMSGNIFQLEINLITGDGKLQPGNSRIFGLISKEDRVLKDWGTGLPFWPPKVEDIEKDSSN